MQTFYVAEVNEVLPPFTFQQESLKLLIQQLHSVDEANYSYKNKGFHGIPKITSKHTYV